MLKVNSAELIYLLPHRGDLGFIEMLLLEKAIPVVLDLFLEKYRFLFAFFLDFCGPRGKLLYDIASEFGEVEIELAVETLSLVCRFADLRHFEHDGLELGKGSS